MAKERIVEIIILIILFLILVFSAIAIKHYKFDKPNTYTILFQDVDSIVKGSPVHFMGINIGHVIKLKRKDKFIICKIKVTKKGVIIPDATRARVEFNGLGGSKSIELSPPLANNTDYHGIVAEKSLRINDFVTVVKDLKDVCAIINDFVQNMDANAVMGDIKYITDPKNIYEADKGIQKMLDRNKHAHQDNFSEIMKQIENAITGFFGQQ